MRGDEVSLLKHYFILVSATGKMYFDKFYCCKVWVYRTFSALEQLNPNRCDSAFLLR